MRKNERSYAHGKSRSSTYKIASKKMTKLNLKYLVPGRTVGRMIKLGQLTT